MVNFIIYEKNAAIKNEYEFSILNFIGIREEKFKIFEFEGYKKFNDSKDIYILSSPNIEKVLSIAKKIRANNDWSSQIIVISNFDNINPKVFMNRLLILDYIDNKSDVKEKLKESLFLSYKIFSKYKTINFMFNGELNKIPYRNVLYIEKRSNQNYSIIHTIEREFIIKDTINNLEKELDCAYFFKTHRSCIVNLLNIKYYDCNNNCIYFENTNKKTDLIAREKRMIFISRLIKNKIIK